VGGGGGLGWGNYCVRGGKKQCGKLESGKYEYRWIIVGWRAARRGKAGAAG